MRCGHQRGLCTWLLCGFLGCLAAASAPAQSYLDRISGGLQLAERGQWDDAGREFSAASSDDADDALGYVGQGVCRLAKGDLDAAAALFRRAESCSSRDVSAWMGLGLCYLEIGRLDLAEDWLNRAASEDRLLAAPPLYLAIIRLCQGRLDDAADLLSRAREDAAPDPLVDYLDALRMAGSGRWPQANELLRRLKPRLIEPLAGKLPLALPLRFERSDKGLSFTIPQRAAFSEAVAPKAFAPARPLGDPATAGPLTLLQPRPNEVVAGRVTVRAELRQARRYQYVVFKVDGRLLTMTNREPFYVVWDTTRDADGPHRVTAQAVGDDQVEVGVEVDLRNTATTRRYDPATVRMASRRLAGMMMHGQPPVALENLLLQTTVERNPEEGIRELEQRVAHDTTRLDLLDSLLGLYRRERWAYTLDGIPEVLEGRPGGKRIALTFDDGPRPGYTERLLQLLQDNGAQGTFFVTGDMSLQHRDLVRLIDAGGQELASHTFSHPHLTSLSRSEVMLELVRAKVAIESAAGRPIPRFFRPPYGKYDRLVREGAAAVGQFPILWSVNATDFLRYSPAVAAQSILRRVRDGSIVLMHNGSVGNTNEILPLLLPQLRAEGYRMVRVSEIIEPPVSAPGQSCAPYRPLPDHELRKYAGKE